MADFIASDPSAPIGGMHGLPLNPFASGLKNMGMLKKKAEKKSFVDYDMASYVSAVGKIATERLRILDNFHLHTPTETECSQFNLPSSRINLLHLKDVLYLCGGLVGARFTSEDLLTLRELTGAMRILWENIEAQFKQLDTSGKKMILVEDSTGDANSSEVLGQVRQFHDLADRYLGEVTRLQGVVARIQQSVDLNGKGTIEKFDADPESKMGKKVPDWLGALMEAFDKSRVSTEPQPNGALKQTPFTVGGFAVYLGGQMLAAKDGQLTATESEALSTLVQASADAECTASGPPSLRPRGHKYWAARFYAFLGAMTELQSKPRGESALAALAQ